MIYSNERKLALSGWLCINDPDEFYKSIKLQKYLFFYECFSKLENDEADFTRLEGWVNGPAFSSVWGDYTKNSKEFVESAKEKYMNMGDLVNNTRAELALFITKVFNESEISEFTHKLNIWKKHENKIINEKIQRVKLDENDLSQDDESLIEMLLSVYDEDTRKNSEVFSIEDNTFIMSKNDYQKLTQDHSFILHELVIKHKESLENPVYVEIDEGGGLIID